MKKLLFFIPFIIFQICFADFCDDLLNDLDSYMGNRRIGYYQSTEYEMYDKANYILKKGDSYYNMGQIISDTLNDGETASKKSSADGNLDKKVLTAGRWYYFEYSNALDANLASCYSYTMHTYRYIEFTGANLIVTCSPEQYFDISDNSCKSCPVGQEFNSEKKLCEPKCSENEYLDTNNTCQSCPFGYRRVNDPDRPSVACELICQNGTYYDESTKQCEFRCQDIKDSFSRFDCACRKKGMSGYSGKMVNFNEFCCFTGDIDCVIKKPKCKFSNENSDINSHDVACSFQCSSPPYGTSNQYTSGNIVISFKDKDSFEKSRNFCGYSSSSSSSSDINPNDYIPIDLDSLDDDGESGATGNIGGNSGGGNNGGNNNTGGDNGGGGGNTGDNNNGNTGGNSNDNGGSGATGNTGLSGGKDNSDNGSSTVTTDNNKTPGNNPPGNGKPDNNNTIVIGGGGGNNSNDDDICKDGNCELYGNIIIESGDNTDYMGEIDKMLDGGSLTGQIQDAVTFFKKGYVPSIQGFPAPKSCVLTREFSGTKIKPVSVEVDFCKVLSTLRDPFYMLFYISFVISFLIAGFKLLIVLFIGVK